VSMSDEGFLKQTVMMKWIEYGQGNKMRFECETLRTKSSAK
jgi:hypothetical protein